MAPPPARHGPAFFFQGEAGGLSSGNRRPTRRMRGPSIARTIKLAGLTSTLSPTTASRPKARASHKTHRSFRPVLRHRARSRRTPSGCLAHPGHPAAPGRDRQCRKERLPGQHERWDPHALGRHHWHGLPHPTFAGHPAAGRLANQAGAGSEAPAGVGQCSAGPVNHVRAPSGFIPSLSS